MRTFKIYQDQYDDNTNSLAEMMANKRAVDILTVIIGSWHKLFTC